MKQSEMLIDRLIEIGNDVRTKKLAVNKARVEIDAYEVANRIAFNEVIAQKLRKKESVIKFYEKSIKKESPEETVSKAAKTLAKVSHKKARVAKK